MPRASSASRSCVASPDESGSSRTCTPSHWGRSSSSSGRATQRRRIGASRLQRLTCSTRSSSVGSAQWTSSRTTSSGRSRARSSKSRRTAQKSSSGGAAPVAAEHAKTLDTSAASGSLAHRFRHRLLAAETLDELRQRPEGDPVAVGEAAARGDGRVRRRPRRRTPTRAASCRPRPRRSPSPAGTHARRRSPSAPSRRSAELARPPDERRVPAAGERIGTGDGAEHAPRLDGSALALRFDRSRAASSREAWRTSRSVTAADQDLAAAGRLLQPLRGVDRVAGGERRRHRRPSRPHRC